MRGLLLIALVLASGCKTAEFAVTHPMTGLHFVARIESHEPLPPVPSTERASPDLPADSNPADNRQALSGLKKATHIPVLEPVS